jgi:transcription elongation factor GreA
MMEAFDVQVMEQDEELILLTPSGRRNIEEELDRLVTVDRHEVANRIRDAKDYGDLTENAEYEAAKNAQAFVEGRILDLKRILASARTLEETEVPKDQVGIGTTVTVKDLGFNDDWTLTIVSAYEADPTGDKISDQSPIGRALIGHKVGEVIKVKTPSGLSSYEIIEIAQ